MPHSRVIKRLSLVSIITFLTHLVIASANASEIPETVLIPSGSFITGSDQTEREYGYTIDEKAYGHTVTRDRGWYDFEAERGQVNTGAYYIALTPITNEQYNAFITSTSHIAPQVDEQTWKYYRLIHPYERSIKFQWPNNEMPKGRGKHPVTMVTIADVTAYAAWLSEKTGKFWRLPTGLEWEKAMRGTDGRYFPWGNEFDASKLNSHDNGPFDTVAVASFPDSASPFGVLDGAGQVFEWIADSPRKNRHIVKGGSWDDQGCGTCRIAASHTRPDTIKHILVGFRLIHD